MCAIGERIKETSEYLPHTVSRKFLIQEDSLIREQFNPY